MPNYNNNILNYYNDNSHVGSFNQKDKNIGTGLVGSPSCGDVMKLQIKIKKDSVTKSDKIIDAKILVFGCGSAKASSSYVAKQLIGKTTKEALKIKNDDIAKILGLPKIKLHCSVLAEKAIKRALEDYENKNKLKKTTDCKKRKIKIFATKKAISFIKEYLSNNKNNIKGIRIGLKTGHCGLMYKIFYIKNNDKVDDCASKTIDKIKFFVKYDDIEILNGIKIDFKDEGLKRGLIFKNPQESGKCNCGLNFFTKNNKIDK